MSVKFAANYAYFCDDNNLPRIDATPEDVLRNLDAMAMCILEKRAEQMKKIADRCPHCGRLPLP